MKVQRIVLFLAFAALSSPVKAQTLINSFETTAEVQSVQCSNAQVAQVASCATQGGCALQASFLPAAWSKVTVPCPNAQSWDWSRTAGLAVDVTNPNDTRVMLIFRVEDAPNLNGAATGDYRSGHCTLEPHETETFLLPYVDSLVPANFGMAGLPYPGIYGASALTGGSPFDPSHVYDYSFALQNVAGPTTLYFDNVRTIAPVSTSNLVDKYGQSMLSAWQGKAANDSDLTAQLAAEQTDIALHPAPSDRDQYGGWAAGPALNATGWFRTALYQNKWWLVTPAGHLFFAMGMDSLRSNNPTFTTGRTSMFQWLPVSPDPLAAYYNLAPDLVNGSMTQGNTYDFYQANLQRKYGANSHNLWAANAASRLLSWGFNAIGDDSDSSTYDRGVPSTVLVTPTGNFDTIPSGSGHGDTFPDAWDPNYVAALDTALSQLSPSQQQDPNLIGYYVNNELSFAGNGTDGNEALPIAVLAASQANSPAKQAFLAKLQSEYTTVGALNTAWGTNFTSWSAMAPGFNVTAPTQACLADLDGFTLAIARQYFQTVKAELGKYDPSHLYLGCRFSYNYLVPQALQACAESADVISLNIYEPRLNAAEWGFLSQYDKPVIVGEFHMGALDRGSFSPGLVAAPSQAARASMFTDYVQSALSSPSLVGVDWYQYMDQPCTGTANDGENGNIGFVSITDNPYPEMVGAARTVGAGLYGFRSNATAVSVDTATAQSGTIVTLSATLTRVDTGAALSNEALTFSLGGNVVGTALTCSNGTAYLQFPVPGGAVVGTSLLTVSFAGDSNNSPVLGSGALTVTPVLTAIAVNATSGQPGSAPNLSALLYHTDGGAVIAGRLLNFTVNGVNMGTAMTDNNGNAVLPYSIAGYTPAGPLAVSVSFGGSVYENPCVATGTLTVLPAMTVVSVPSVSGSAGSSVRIAATLSRVVTGALLQGQPISLYVNGVAIGTATTYSSGQAYIAYTIPANAPAGTEPISVSYSGDANDSGAIAIGTLTVLNLPTAVAVASVSGAAGGTVTLSAALTRTDTGAPLQGKTLTFAVNGATVGTAATYSSGQTTLTYKIPANAAAGSLNVTVGFSGDASDKSSTGTGTVTVLNLPTAITAFSNVSAAAGGTVTFSATLTRTDTGAPLQGKTLTFTVNGATIGTAATYSSGSASLSYKVPAGAAAGAQTVTVTFAQDASDKSSTARATLTVLNLPTAIGVDALSGSAGKTVTLSATLTRSDTGVALANKTLAFSVNGVSIGTAVTYSTGKAYLNYKVPAGATGKQTVAVTFAADASDKSSSGQGTLTVQ